MHYAYIMCIIRVIYVHMYNIVIYIIYICITYVRILQSVEFEWILSLL